jgi:hypothetical protein
VGRHCVHQGLGQAHPVAEFVVEGKFVDPVAISVADGLLLSVGTDWRVDRAGRERSGCGGRCCMQREIGSVCLCRGGNAAAADSSHDNYYVALLGDAYWRRRDNDKFRSASDGVRSAGGNDLRTNRRSGRCRGSGGAHQSDTAE